MCEFFNVEHSSNIQTAESIVNCFSHKGLQWLFCCWRILLKKKVPFICSMEPTHVCDTRIEWYKDIPWISLSCSLVECITVERVTVYLGLFRWWISSMTRRGSFWRHCLVVGDCLNELPPNWQEKPYQVSLSLSLSLSLSFSIYYSLYVCVSVSLSNLVR